MYWRAYWARCKTERWTEELVTQVRGHKLNPPPARALAVISQHRNLNGNLLDTNVAAVELLNILRPTTAVARWLIFAALALA